jgi:four helix bundle protein
MKVFIITKTFPVEDKFALTSQIIRSSRSVCSAIAEAYRKRKYKKHFISKLPDADNENAETQLCVDFALACNYILNDAKVKLENQSQEVGKLLNYMMFNPGKFGVQ